MKSSTVRGVGAGAAGGAASEEVSPLEAEAIAAGDLSEARLQAKRTLGPNSLLVGQSYQTYCAALMNPSCSKLLGAVAGVLLALAIVGCPGGPSVKKAPEPCRQLGQQCEFSPGKLGACSYRANCSGADCLYCQSQH